MSMDVNPIFLFCLVGIWWICFPRSVILLQPHVSDEIRRPRPSFIRLAGVVLLLLPFAFVYL